MGFNNDTKNIFEAYKLLNEASTQAKPITEAPIDPGARFDEPDVASQISPEYAEKLAKYKVPSGDAIHQIVAGVKEFLLSHENKHFPGTYQDFRNEIAKIIQTKAGIGLANSKYAARVIQNELVRLEVISVDKKTGEVEVTDVTSDKGDLATDVETVVKQATAKEAPKHTEIRFRVKYDIDEAAKLPEDDEDLRIAKSDIVDSPDINDGSSGKHILQALVTRYGYETAKKYADDLVKADVLVPVEEKPIEVFERPDEEDEERDKSEEIEKHVSRAEWGSKRPVFGAEED